MASGRKNRIFKWFLFLLFSLTVIAVTISVIIVSQRELPDNDLKLAREAIAGAKSVGADLYSESKYKESVSLYDSAMSKWSKENALFILKRDYSQVISLAKNSKKIADKSKEESITKAENLSKNGQNAFINISKQIELFNKVFKVLPLSKALFDAHNKAKMYLSESKIAHENNKLKESEVFYKKAEIQISYANTTAAKFLRNYFNDYPLWQKWANNAIAESKNGNRVILVDKFAKMTYIYQSGKVIKSFESEFGPNWMSHKERYGDKATPEGNYVVTKKKEGGNTIYYKALLINYPNEEDKRRFAIRKKNGEFTRNTSIGNLIEIHGGGGKGFHWTSGCVGVTNKDMDEIYKLSSVGTRVTIVGSLEPLSKVTNGIEF